MATYTHYPHGYWPEGFWDDGYWADGYWPGVADIVDSASNTITFGQIVNRIIEEALDNDITFGQILSTAGSIYNKVPSNAITFGQILATEVVRLASASNSITFGQELARVIEGTASNAITFGQVLSPAGSEYLRTLANAIAFGQILSTAGSIYNKLPSNAIAFGQLAVGAVDEITGEGVNSIAFTQIAGYYFFVAYTTVNFADGYLRTRLNTREWKSASLRDKEASLQQATEIIERLNFAGNKASASQRLFFPRDTDTEVPVAVQKACAEIALALLKEMLLETSSAKSYGFGRQLRVRYDPKQVQPHTEHGIPSITAWRYLKPYIRSRAQLQHKV
jgi:hypothetical protein